MKKKISSTYLLLLMIIGVTASVIADSGTTEAGPPSIVGTYKLIVRELPDGTKFTTPNIMGLLTFTEKYRNFNTQWQDESGKHFSYSVVSEYKLSNTEYAETILFSILNDEISGQQVNYGLVGKTKTVPVTMDGSKLKIDLPFDPATIVIDGNRIKAKVLGQFTDYWERVD
jgi:hypothetical protein